MDHSCRSLEDSSTDNWKTGDTAPKVSEGTILTPRLEKFSVILLVNNLAAFYHCPVNLLMAKFKINGLISLVGRFQESLILTLYDGY